jgi:hypothetical protein
MNWSGGRTGAGSEDQTTPPGPDGNPTTGGQIRSQRPGSHGLLPAERAELIDADSLLTAAADGWRSRSGEALAGRGGVRQRRSRERREGQRLAVVLPGGRRIEVGRGFDAGTLGRDGPATLCWQRASPASALVPPRGSVRRLNAGLDYCPEDFDEHAFAAAPRRRNRSR